MSKTKANTSNGSTIHVEHQLVTPAMAEKMLKQNIGNRPFSQWHADRLSSEIKEGRWRTTGETIKFTKTNKLVDGQHRLTAIIATGVPQELVVVYGLEEDSFEGIDVNQKNRSTADLLALKGNKNNTELSSALSLVHGYYMKTLPKRTRMTVTERAELLDAYPTMPSSVSWAVSSGSTFWQGILPKGTVACAHYIFSHAWDTPFAEHYLTQVRDGENLRKGNPAYAVRKTLIRHSSNLAEFPREISLAVVIKGWNAFVSNKSMALAHFRSTESYPVAKSR